MTDERQKIKDLVLSKGITRLCHFTQSRKLGHILSNPRGILSTRELLIVAPDIVDVTDANRLDGHPDHICCSVEFPNSWYLQKIKYRDPIFKDWVILFINPSILWLSKALFCPRNAAAEYGNLVKAGYESLTSLFQPAIAGSGGKIRTRTSQMLANCPTDDQAEVLIEREIPRDKIQGVAVVSEEQRILEITRLSMIKEAIEVKWVVAPQLFTTECSKLIRTGKRPEEKELKG